MGSTIDRLRRFIESSLVQNFILIVIIINAIVLGMQTSPGLMADYGVVLNLIDNIALGIFVVELSIKLIVYRFSFFKDGWNIFDFI
ncbi:MAG: ion transporter, partial [Planctomycetes bacterium]|nr:ion transporter [Planctomycetota bacterium]